MDACAHARIQASGSSTTCARLPGAGGGRLSLISFDVENFAVGVYCDCIEGVSLYLT